MIKPTIVTHQEATVTDADFRSRSLPELVSILAKVTQEIEIRTGAALPNANPKCADPFSPGDIISPAQAGGMVDLESSTITRMAQSGVPWAHQLGGKGGKWQISRSLFLREFSPRLR